MGVAPDLQMDFFKDNPFEGLPFVCRNWHEAICVMLWRSAYILSLAAEFAIHPYLAR
jgi:hypothetical protein